MTAARRCQNTTALAAATFRESTPPAKARRSSRSFGFREQHEIVP